MISNGDIVMLNSGGPLMTITDKRYKEYCCTWYGENNKLNTFWFPFECLCLVNNNTTKILEIIKNYHTLISTESLLINYLYLISSDFTLEESLQLLNSVVSSQDFVFSPNYKQINDRLNLKNAYPYQVDGHILDNIIPTDKSVSVFLHQSKLLSEETKKGVVNYLITSGFNIHTVVQL